MAISKAARPLTAGLVSQQTNPTQTECVQNRGSRAYSRGVRQIPLTLAISFGLHVLPVWACWNLIQGMAPSAPLLLVQVGVDEGEAAVVVGASDPDDGGMAGSGSESGGEDEQRRSNLRRVREQASSALAKRRAEAEIAQRALALRTHDLEERVQSAHAAAELVAARQDALQTSIGHLRVARAPADQATELARLAAADVARALAEAEAAQARAELAAATAAEQRAVVEGTGTVARRARRTPPEARAKEGDAAPATSKANAERARANAAMQQATQALAHADEVRAAEARALAAVAPVEAAVQADEEAAAKAADAQEQADHDVLVAQQALVASTAELAAAARQVERAAARAQIDPDDWVHLPAPSSPPGVDAGHPEPRGSSTASADAQGVKGDTAAPTEPPAPAARPAAPPAAAPASPLTTAVASALAALTFVRTDGDAPAEWDPTARLIGTSSLHATVMSRSLTNVTPVKTVPPAPAGSPGEAPSAQSAAGVARLAPLRSDGPAPDGFVLAILDDTARAPSRAASARAEPAAAEASATDPQAVDPDEPPITEDPPATVSVAPEYVPEGAVTRLSVSGHPLATWMNGVDEAVRRGWTYPLEARALGIHGTVEVRFTVLQSGRVTDIKVMTADAPPDLVNAATGSVPSRMKPPPPGSGEVEIRYTYRYRLANGA